MEKNHFLEIIFSKNESDHYADFEKKTSSKFWFKLWLFFAILAAKHVFFEFYHDSKHLFSFEIFPVDQIWCSFSDNFDKNRIFFAFLA